MSKPQEEWNQYYQNRFVKVVDAETSKLDQKKKVIYQELTANIHDKPSIRSRSNGKVHGILISILTKF